MCMGCCGPISFEWAVEHGYVNGQMKRADYQPRYDRWKRDVSHPEERPETQIDRWGNLIGVDGVLTNGWKSAFILQRMDALKKKSD